MNQSLFTPDSEGQRLGVATHVLQRHFGTYLPVQVCTALLPWLEAAFKGLDGAGLAEGLRLRTRSPGGSAWGSQWAGCL